MNGNNMDPVESISHLLLGIREMISTELFEQIEEYLRLDKNTSTHEEIIDLIRAMDVPKLEKLFLSRLEFGTAGIRGKMGGGYSQMNDLVIIQTSQGLSAYLHSLYEERPRNCVVIGYDGRHNSKRFAYRTASALLHKGFKVYLFRKPVPTPWIPFAVTLLQAVCGVMITASHNPKEDNGYKVYWENGAQIISPHDKKIQHAILGNLNPWENAWDDDLCVNLDGRTKTYDPMEFVEPSYLEIVRKDSLHFCHPDIHPDQTKLEFTYTPMHGVGAPFVDLAFKSMGLKPLHHVPEQENIDPDFPTVKFPNPEEGKSALKLAMSKADSVNSTIILANDPDADRLAVAEKQGETWKVFTGNELGALLGWWAFHLFHSRGSKIVPVENCYMLASTVSSKILKSMASKEGFNFVETLTGFKWMGNETVQIMESMPDKRVLFAFEEAIGFMFGPAVLDKDGINAAVRMAELAIYLESQNKTLQDQLNWIWNEYGYHVSENSYYICHNPNIIKEIFTRLRTYEDGKELTYPKTLMGGKYSIVSVRDLTAGYDSNEPDNVPVLPVSKSSQMITFEIQTKVDCRVVATLRTSGTEPKVKYYSELIASPSSKDWEALNNTLHEIVQALVDEFLQPTKYGKPIIKSLDSLKSTPSKVPAAQSIYSHLITMAAPNGMPSNMDIYFKLQEIANNQQTQLANQTYLASLIQLLQTTLSQFIITTNTSLNRIIDDIADLD